MSGVPAAERAGSLGGGGAGWPLMVMVVPVVLEEVLVLSPAIEMVVQCSGEPEPEPEPEPPGAGLVLMFTRLWRRRQAGRRVTTGKTQRQEPYMHSRMVRSAGTTGQLPYMQRQTLQWTNEGNFNGIENR